MPQMTVVMKTIRVLFWLPVVVSLSLSLRQPIQSKTPPIRSESLNQDEPTGCEYNTSVLDGLAQSTSLDELIIVIAHLGRNETKSTLNHRRLDNVRVFLTEYLTNPKVRRKQQTIILAEGERANGLGRVEFYVDGKLVDTLRMRTNADLSLGNCGWEPPQDPCPPLMKNFYPCRDKRVRRVRWQ
jgi:hypothetical protein